MLKAHGSCRYYICILQADSRREIRDILVCNVITFTNVVWAQALRAVTTERVSGVENEAERA